MLTGFLLVNLSKSLGLLAVFQAIMFGCSAAAVLWNWQALRSRTAELHLNAAVMVLAGMPFYQAAKAGVLLAQLPTGGFPPRSGAARRKGLEGRAYCVRGCQFRLCTLAP